MKCWTPDGAYLSEHLKSVSEHVARCTIWVGPSTIPSSDGSKKSSGIFGFDNLTKINLHEENLVVPKSQMADISIVSELAAIILSCSFSVDGGSGNTVADAQRLFSISMVLDLSLMNSLQPVLHALSDRLNRVSRTFERIISEAARRNLDEYIAAGEYTVKRAMDHISRLLTPQGFDLGDFSKTIFITTPQDTNWDFFAKCAFSFLCTQRRAVVFSSEKSNADSVNSIIRALAALCTPELLQYSKLLVPDQIFIPDMYLQGLDEMPLLDDLLECGQPLTLIDLDQQKVRRFKSTEEFELRKHKMIDSDASSIADRVTSKLASHSADHVASRPSESKSDNHDNSSLTLTSLKLSPSLTAVSVTGNPLSSNEGGLPDDAILGGGRSVVDEEDPFIDVELAAPFILQMMDRVLQAPPFLRQAVLQQSLRVLLRWSLALIEHLPRTSESDVELRSKVKSCQQEFGISSELDFQLVLLTADSCRPGFYSSLCSSEGVEKLVLDLFESF